MATNLKLLAINPSIAYVVGDLDWHAPYPAGEEFTTSSGVTGRRCVTRYSETIRHATEEGWTFLADVPLWPSGKRLVLFTRQPSTEQAGVCLTEYEGDGETILAAVSDTGSPATRCRCPFPQRCGHSRATA